MGCSLSRSEAVSAAVAEQQEVTTVVLQRQNTPESSNSNYNQQQHNTSNPALTNGSGISELSEERKPCCGVPWFQDCHCGRRWRDAAAPASPSNSSSNDDMPWQQHLSHSNLLGAHSDEPQVRTACCGQLCQNPHTRLCCEHSGIENPNNYCQICFDRYQEWQEANVAFLDIVSQTEHESARNVNAMILNQDKKDGKVAEVTEETEAMTETEEEALLLSQETEEQQQEEQDCPVCLEPFCSEDGREACFLPCGHAVCHEHMDRLQNRCPVCRSPVRRRRCHSAPYDLGARGNNAVLTEDELWGHHSMWMNYFMEAAAPAGGDSVASFGRAY